MPATQHTTRTATPEAVQRGIGDANASANGRRQAGARSDLRPPPAIPSRWMPQRKAEIVAAVGAGALTLDEACERYALTVEEFLGWQHGINLFGLAGLRVGGVQFRRRATDAAPLA